jgi:hypothetical protein
MLSQAIADGTAAKTGQRSCSDADLAMLPPAADDDRSRLIPSNIYVDCLGDPADFGKRARQGRWFIPDLQCAHDTRRLEMPEFQRAGEADHIGPVFADQREIDGAFAEAVERAVIGLPVNPPQPGITEVSEPRAELVAKQPEQTKHRIGIGGGVGHEFHWLQLGFLFEEKGEQHQAVPQGAGNHDAVQAAELVGQQIVPSHPSRLTEYFGFGPA